jgi:lysophospholipase L1-like esterase
MRSAVALLALVAACAAFLIYLPPGSSRERVTLLQPPFDPDVAAFWVATVRSPAWALRNERARTRLVLRENGRALRGAPVYLEETAEGGARLTFHTSDRSDPNSNSRTYDVVYETASAPLPVYVMVVIVALTACFLFAATGIEHALGRRSGLRGLAYVLVSATYGVALLESLCAVALSHHLAANPGLRASYDRVFQPDASETSPRADSSSMNFMGHPYLNFVLNPEAVFGGKKQFNARYHVRRSEPIRPRGEVAWRALVIGGSTAFDQKIAKEEETWVYKLEDKIRRQYGPDYDVINGGVGGYNIINNFIHYVLLLDELDPDLIILFVGINDVHPRLIGDLERDYTNSQIQWNDARTGLPRVDPWLAHFATYRFLKLRQIEEREFGHLFMFIQRSYPPLDEWPEALERNGSEVFAAHLRNLVTLLLAQGRSVFIVPQVFLPRNEQDRVFARGVDEHTEICRRIALELSVPFADQVAGSFEPIELADNCHFNRRGSEKMAAILFDLLRAAEVMPAKRAAQNRR